MRHNKPVIHFQAIAHDQVNDLILHEKTLHCPYILYNCFSIPTVVPV